MQGKPRRTGGFLLAFAITSLLCGSALGADVIRCTVVADAQSGATILRQGSCDQRFYPQSTFKLALAMMGYDAGILVDARTPLWPYEERFKAPKRVRRDTDPSRWLADSVVWYSQQLTGKLGSDSFADYVQRFGYGNGDVSGTPRKNNGLTQAWLMSSLKISADEQVDFLRRFLNGGLPISDGARAMTLSVTPTFAAGDGWSVKGKTGAGWLRDSAGKSDPDRPLGWFVGWAEKGDRRVVFARLLVDTHPYKDAPISYVVRDQLLADLPGLIKGKP
ncbi:MAG: class D beta-lactamase [Allorhizobium sp.]